MKDVNLKIFLIFIISAIFLAGNTYSQDNQKVKTPEERAKKITERLNKTVNLTESQQNTIQGIYTNHFTKMQGLRESMKGKDKSEIKETMKQARTELKTSVKEALTKDQQDKLKQAMKEKMRKHRRHCRHHRHH